MLSLDEDPMVSPRKRTPAAKAPGRKPSRKATQGEQAARAAARKGPARARRALRIQGIDPRDFDRLTIMTGGVGLSDPDAELAGLICSSLGALSSEKRQGVAYIQMGAPRGDDYKVFEGNAFFPSYPVVACVTGTIQVVTALAASLIVGLRYDKRTKCMYDSHVYASLPLCAAVQDGTVVASSGGVFKGWGRVLEATGWRQRLFSDARFGRSWRGPAMGTLAALPRAVKRCPRCRSPRVVRLHYGPLDAGRTAAVRRGDLVIASPFPALRARPSWLCRVCETRWPQPLRRR